MFTRKQLEGRRCYEFMIHTDLDIKLARIEENRERSHFYRWEMMRYKDTPIDVQLASDFSYQRETGTVRLSLTARYTTMRDQVCRRLLDYCVSSDFEIHGVDAKSAMTEILGTEDMLRLMLSVTVGAMRGMLALRTEKTFLANYPLPLYNIDNLVAPIINSASVGEAE